MLTKIHILTFGTAKARVLSSKIDTGLKRDKTITLRFFEKFEFPCVQKSKTKHSFKRTNEMLCSDLNLVFNRAATWHEFMSVTPRTSK